MGFLHAGRCLLILFMLSGLLSCGRRAASVEQHAPTVMSVFHPVLPPAHLRGAERVAYLRAHYWDRFDFADTTFLARVDTVRMLDAFAVYVAGALRDNDPAPMERLMAHASTSRAMLEYFAMLAQRVLDDPNSPLRSDVLYVPVLRALLGSPWLDRWERIAPEHDLRMALQNRVGQLANDFRYRLRSGVEGSLYRLQAPYTLLFFSNPECPMCRDVQGQLEASPLLGGMIASGEVRVLVISPDADAQAGHDATSHYPTSWLEGYDPLQTIRDDALYDLRAIPSLYLLDRNKRVLVKDAADARPLEQVLEAQR